MKLLFSVICLSLFAFNKANCESKPKLIDYRKSVFSQAGEDGIIEKILECIGTTSKIVIEFGAHDGFTNSNTANLWTKDPSWEAILIEASPGLYDHLVRNVAPYPCIPILRKVGISETDSLESILKEYNVPNNIDLLSIDIDGDDYYILQSLTTLRPRVIVCESNPSIPAHLDVYPDYGNYMGCSVAALQRIATEKGYSLVAINGANCFFVRNDEFHKLSEFDTDREHIRWDRFISYIINDYSGGYKILGVPDFYDAWGWSNKKSTYPIHGNFIEIQEDIDR